MTRLRIASGAALLALALGALPARAADWTRYDNCRVITGRYADGDSFHVATPAGERIFRLYYVDAPETDTNFPDRVKEQAGYFKVSMRRALELGESARDFTARFLRQGFTVFTRGEDAEGRSELPREFALIRVGNQWLDVALVEAGMARVYGKSAPLPDGTAAKRHWSDLHEAEQRAKAARAGAWGAAAGGSAQGPRQRTPSPAPRGRRR